MPTGYRHHSIDTVITYWVWSSPTGYGHHPPGTGVTPRAQAALAGSGTPVPFLSVANSWLPQNCQHLLPMLCRTPLLNAHGHTSTQALLQTRQISGILTPIDRCPGSTSQRLPSAPDHACTQAGQRAPLSCPPPSPRTPQLALSPSTSPVSTTRNKYDFD